jgi:hypothetical protein
VAAQADVLGFAVAIFGPHACEIIPPGGTGLDSLQSRRVYACAPEAPVKAALGRPAVRGRLDRRIIRRATLGCLRLRGQDPARAPLQVASNHGTMKPMQRLP